MSGQYLNADNTFTKLPKEVEVGEVIIVETLPKPEKKEELILDSSNVSEKLPINLEDKI